jgi:hypothetical protein
MLFVFNFMAIYILFFNICQLFHQPYLENMAHNVPGCKRRFASPDKGLRSKAMAGKLWRSEAWERAQRPT